MVVAAGVGGEATHDGGGKFGSLQNNLVMRRGAG